MSEIQNIQVSTYGAELTCLVAGGWEYLWQGDPQYWGRRAPILFPIVGRLANDTLRIDDAEHQMKQHGFARDAEFEQLSDEPLVMRMIHEQPIANYPYDFDLQVRYTISGNTLKVDWDVTNNGDRTMYFQIGAHPAFTLPEYDASDDVHGYIQFYDDEGKVVSPMVIHYLEGGLRCTYGAPKALINDQAVLALTNSTFADDALLLEGRQVASASLFDKAGHRVLTVRCPQADAFGIWAPNKRGCPFVCIEPWCGVADRKGFNGDISEKDCIHCLISSDNYQFSYSITIE